LAGAGTSRRYEKKYSGQHGAADSGSRGTRRRVLYRLTASREFSVLTGASDAVAPAEVYDAEFSGARGDRIRAWYLKPATAGAEHAPVVVRFIGYGPASPQKRTIFPPST